MWMRRLLRSLRQNMLHEAIVSTGADWSPFARARLTASFLDLSYHGGGWETSIELCGRICEVWPITTV